MPYPHFWWLNHHVLLLKSQPFPRPDEGGRASRSCCAAAAAQWSAAGWVHRGPSRWGAGIDGNIYSKKHGQFTGNVEILQENHWIFHRKTPLDIPQRKTTGYFRGKPWKCCRKTTGNESKHIKNTMVSVDFLICSTPKQTNNLNLLIGERLQNSIAMMG